MTICVDVLGASVLTEEEEHSYIWGRQENLMRIDFNSRYQYGFMTLKICICIYYMHVYVVMYICICIHIFVYIFIYVCI